MVGPLVSHVYRYPFESQAVPTPRGMDLRLATSGPLSEPSRFFRGRLTRPRRAADLLQGLVEIVQARFYLPPSSLSRMLAMADPVVTCGSEVLRFEAFSGCCGVYARVDLLPPALDGEWLGRGTTNVDFNAPMRASLACVRDGEDLGLAISDEEVELIRGTESVVERKVKLPIRWLKGFVEVQAFQSRMVRVAEVPGLEAVRFLRSLPRGTNAGSGFVIPASRGVRISQSPASDGVRVVGLNRLRVLEPLARHARLLRIYNDPATGATGWELVLDEARWHLIVSPEPVRGFSGEGQVLDALAVHCWEDFLAPIHAALRWQNQIEPAYLAARFALAPDEIAAALAALGSRGLVGYDLETSAYFYRELPFDLSQIEVFHPRLLDARALVKAGGVKITRRDLGQIEAIVNGSTVEHRVILTEEASTCTCPWFSKHQGERGPCKHLLATRIVVGVLHEEA